MIETNVVVIGAGAAGLMCAIEAAKRGRDVVILDHANKPGKKILMSGGGRCNFTNYYASPENYISHNPHFCKSALSRYTQWDFISLVEKHKIPYYEKTLGQLFCENKAKDIVNMLLAECAEYHALLKLDTCIESIAKSNNKFIIKTYYKKNNESITYSADSVVIACGGLSIPTMGATNFGYKIAKQFGLNIFETKPALVPFRLSDKQNEIHSSISGVSHDATAECNNTVFKEGMLFTHRGISGPSILQISSYWKVGDTVSLNLLPDYDLSKELFEQQQKNPDKNIKTILSRYLPKNIVKIFLENYCSQDYSDYAIKQLNHKQLQNIIDLFTKWQIKPIGTEGYRTAEVTLGGVDVNKLSSKTMEVKSVQGLYFVGEVLDVTGWLGGYNFQWAWSSGWVAGQYA